MSGEEQRVPMRIGDFSFCTLVDFTIIFKALQKRLNQHFFVYNTNTSQKFTILRPLK